MSRTGNGAEVEGRNTIALEQVDAVWLRAWVNEGIITAQEFEAEMRRRALEPAAAQPDEPAASNVPTER